MYIGLTLDQYWDMTPALFKKYVSAYIKKEKAREKEIDMNNHVLGQYIYFAFNNPQEYPKTPFFDTLNIDEKNEKHEKHEDDVMTTSQMEHVMRVNTIKLGGKIK
jgi:hypothetical protein